MKTLTVRRVIPLGEEDLLLRTFPSSAGCTVVNETTALVREDGTPLCYLLKKAVPLDEIAPLYQAIHNRISVSHNRGVSSGQKAKARIKKDGTLARTPENPVLSSVMGFYDRYPRIPYCRQTAFNQNHPEDFARCLPAIRRVDSLFQATLPGRYAVQAGVAARSSPDFLIPGTVFTTVTMNRNFRTACHRDAGDLKEGFGCLLYMRSGRFSGGDLMFPAYGCGVRMDTGDLVLFDPHEIHGNTEISAYSDKWERITCVFYFREKIMFCGSAAQELDRAKRFGAKGVGTTHIDWREGLSEDPRGD